MAAPVVALGLHWPDRHQAKERPMLGQLFVARARRGLLWIGWSNAPGETLRIIQRYSPETVRLVATHNATPQTMVAIHRLLDHHRVRKESCWFRAMPETLAVLTAHGCSPHAEHNATPATNLSQG